MGSTFLHSRHVMYLLRDTQKYLENVALRLFDYRLLHSRKNPLKNDDAMTLKVDFQSVEFSEQRKFFCLREKMSL